MEKIILERKKMSENPSDKHLEIVLCKLPENTITPYVTWGYNKNTDSFFSGDYCYSIDEAVNSYNSRGINPV